MRRVRAVLALALLGFTIGATFAPHASHAMKPVEYCTPNDPGQDPDDTDPGDYTCH